jgi:lipase
VTEIRSFERRSLPGAGGTAISTAIWPGEGEALVCVHGLTSSSMAYAGLATELPDKSIVSVDCRGRGGSSKEGPFGLSWHVADLVAVMDALEVGRATVVGHSMGAFVAAAFCADFPERVSHLVFVDGGHFREYPESLTPEMLLPLVLGPFLEKFKRPWSSVEEYIAYYESTPLYPAGVDDYGRAHFAYDLEGEPPDMRVRIVEECLLPDYSDVLDRPVVSKRLDGVTVPLLLVRAPDGLTGIGDEVVPDEVRDAITSRVPDTTVVDVPGTNHHTILFSKPGAKAVAGAIEAFLG